MSALPKKPEWPEGNLAREGVVVAGRSNTASGYKVPGVSPSTYVSLPLRRADLEREPDPPRTSTGPEGPFYDKNEKPSWRYDRK